jgi:hypothetical protein
MTPWARHPGYDIHGVYPDFGDFDSLTRDLDTGTRAAASTLQVCPVGAVFRDVYTSHPDIELFSRGDGNHASGAGAYLVALVSYGCIYDDDPGEVTWAPSALSADDVRALKAAASRSFRAPGHPADGPG